MTGGEDSPTGGLLPSSQASFQDFCEFTALGEGGFGGSLVGLFHLAGSAERQLLLRHAPSKKPEHLLQLYTSGTSSASMSVTLRSLSARASMPMPSTRVPVKVPS